MKRYYINWRDADGFWADEYANTVADAKLIRHVRMLTQRDCICTIIDQDNGGETI